MYGSMHLPRDALADMQVFMAGSPAAGVGWQRWRKRPGTSMLGIYVLGGGAAGGGGAVGANSTAGGGAGGGSGGQTYLQIPALLLPETLFISVGVGGGATNGILSRVSVAPDTVVNNCVAYANGGTVGGTGTGTAGIAGAAAAVATLANMPLAVGPMLALAGQIGTNGGGATAGVALTLPVTGLRVTGGTGGGGLGAAAATGLAGGAFTVAGVFPPQPGGIIPGTTTGPGGDGSNGLLVLPKYGYYYGGTGGASMGGASVGGRSGNGGAGGLGSGGGGGGGALTGLTAGLPGNGGDGLIIITAW